MKGPRWAGRGREPCAVALAVLLLVLPAPGARAQDPAFTAAEAQNFAAASGRAQAWLADPAFAAAPATVDPARDPARWAPARGRVVEVSWENRYGARVAGTLFAPKDGPGPFPAVVMVSGAGVAQDAYRWVGEDLAEHGYVVLTFDPQGQGASDVEPDSRYCDPEGDWREPQELGLREQGECAGQDPAGMDAATPQVEFLAQARTGRVDPETIGPVYRALAPRFIFGAFDATAWLLSDANPWRSLVDGGRLGIAGHSLGAYAANMTGNGDPARRFRAAVAMDAFYANDLGVGPRVPTLLMQSEQESLVGPHTAPPADPRAPTTLHPPRATYDAFRAGPVDAGFLVPSASNHNEFTDALQPASLLGQRTAALALIAWMDEYVVGTGGLPRLLARTAGDSADVSSIGTAQPKIAGRSHAELLSFLYPTDLSLLGRECLDLQAAACAAPPPCSPRAAATAVRGRRTVGVTVRARRACGRVGTARVALRRSGLRLVATTALIGPRDEATVTLRIPRRARERALRVAVRIDGGRTLRLPLPR